MRDRTPQRLEFGVSDQDAWGVGLACGGTVRIFVESVEANREAFEVAEAAVRAKRPVVVATPLDGGPAHVGSPEELPAELIEPAQQALRRDEALTVETPTGPVFVNPLNPPLRLVVVGAVHIATSLAVIAGIVGYEVTVVDPRRAFARAERWPAEVIVKAEWPDEAMAGMVLDRRAAVVALTHDPKIDDPALTAALRSGAFYIGALGSKKTHAARVHRLAAQGFGDEEIARIHGPVGLDIGARSPPEIALAILGQMTVALRKGEPPRTARPVDRGAG
jgi:xanthine dehydrogenase accessory factor